MSQTESLEEDQRGLMKVGVSKKEQVTAECAQGCGCLVPWQGHGIEHCENHIQVGQATNGAEILQPWTADSFPKDFHEEAKADRRCEA